MKKYITTLLAVSCALAAFSMPVSALEYSFDGADAGEFGKPTSVETIYVSREPTNIDRSKKRGLYSACVLVHRHLTR